MRQGTVNSRRVAPTLVRATLVAIAATFVVAVVAPLPADASMEITGFTADVLDAESAVEGRAGAHPFVAPSRLDIATDGTFNGVSGHIKTAIVDLPLGFVGDPSTLPTCTLNQLSGDGQRCPVASQVGVANLNLSFVGVLPFQWIPDIPIYNLVAPRGQPAQFAFQVADVTVMLDVSVRPADNGVRVVTEDISATLPLAAIDVQLWGVPAAAAHDAQRTCPNGTLGCAAGTSPVPFLSNATRCDEPQVTVLRANSWQDQDTWIEREHVAPPLEGCDRLAFEPEVAVRPSTDRADAPAGYTVELTQELQDSVDGLAPAHLKDAVVTLPEGVSINPAAADGLQSCSEAQIGLREPGAPTCPAASKVGTVEIKTPLLDEPLVGPVYQAAQGANPFGSTFAIYLAPRSDRYGVQMKLAGRVEADPVTGQLTTTFANNPQQPFSKLTLKLKGGERALLANPDSCGQHVASARLTAWSGKAVDRRSSFEIACESGLGSFAPTLSAGAVSPAGGSFSPFALRIDKPDGHADVEGLSLAMPAGLLAKLKGNMGQRVGTAHVASGPGASPFWLSGPVVLEGPYGDAPLSLRVTVPVKAGPFDLGEVVVRQKLYVDRTTAQVTVVSDPLPTIVEGVPVRLQSLAVDIDEPEFTVNPSDCSEKRVEATVLGSDGASAALASRFQVANCARLDFRPRLGLRLVGGKQRRTGGHPALRARLTHGGFGSAGIGRARVKLPRSLALDPDNAQALCEFVDGTKPDLENHCPAGSKVGRARASSPLLDRDLVGDVYFVKNVRVDPETGNEIRTLPMIVVALRGQIALNLRGVATTTRNGQLVSTFKRVPDAPLDRFNLNIKGGANGILVVTGDRSGDIDLCTSPQRTRTIMAGHNGARVNALAKVRTPCPKGQWSKAPAGGRR